MLQTERERLMAVDPPIEPVYPIESLLVIGRIGGLSVAAARKSIAAITRLVREKLDRYYAELATKRLQKILMPNGKPIGERGNSHRVRILKGGDAAAQKLYNQLKKRGVEETPKNYDGHGTRLPNGDWVGYRLTSKSKLPTVETHIKNLEFKKIHFLD